MYSKSRDLFGFLTQWFPSFALCVALLSGPSVFSQTANFTANVQSGCSPLTVQFTDLSTGTIHSWFWDFGNGNTSTFDDVIATYTSPGTYTVSLTVTDTLSGNSSTRTEVAYITVFAEPVADFIVDVSSGCAPLTVNFSDASIPGDGPLASYSWDFGDGNLGTGPNPSHTYTTAGDFTVTLVVTDVNGCGDTRIQTDLISITDVANVDFTASPRTGCTAPITVNFNSSVSPAGTYTYLWDFGDGNTSNQANPNHTYTTNGDYDVSLTITDINNCQEVVTKNNYVIINNPTADFTALNTNVCTGQAVDFFNNSVGADSYVWNFGDGNTALAENPSHSYSVPGTYSVSLTANNSAGCSDTEIKNNFITVHVSPAASFTANNNIGCQIPLLVNFTDQSAGSIIAWSWDFGNGNFSNAPNPTTTYTTPGTYNVSLTVTSADGCQSTETIPNYVLLSEPDAEFTTGIFRGCVPLTVDFVDLSTSLADPITSWVWNFGDGNISTQQSPSHTYTAAGQYTVTLTVSTASGCQNTEIFQFVEVGNRPVADFDAMPRVACVNEDVNFTDLTIGTVTAWEWAFGDGGGSTDTHPTHVYQDTGTFDVILIVEHFGCRDTMIKTDFVTIQGAVANFTMTPTVGCNPPLDVAFFDQSINPGLWHWDFGDGDTSLLENPIHTYSTVGSYTVTLVVTDTVTGCADDFTQVIDITNPIAGFSANPTTGCPPLDVDFTNSSINATSYIWDFGDGSVSNAANPTHTYTNPGTYDVTLIASDGACSDTLVLPNYITISGPVVDFAADTLNGCAALSVNFSDLSYTTGASTLVSWVWDFGDGNTGSGPNPGHTYSNPGQYDVTLSVLDSDGCLLSLTKTAYIQATFPTADFITSDTIACPGSFVSFTSTSMGVGLSYLWDFGDGTTSTAINPTHLYPNNGSYTVSLTVTDVNGCQDTEGKLNFLTIGRPTANFTADNTSATCPPLIVNYTDLSSPDVVSWYWDFGDGSTSTLANPSKIYATVGSFDVSLVVTNSQGCRDTLDMPNLINITGPTGSFSFSPLVGCQPLNVTFTVDSPNPLWTYDWDFGDGTGGTGTTTTHTYVVDTTANPILLVEDQNGCIVPVSSPDQITIQPLPMPSFTVDYIQICLGQTANFTNTTTSERTVTSYLWDFGDGTSSNSVSPSHTYLDTGTYVVNLQATTVDGCVNSTSTPITITVTQPPSAVFSVNPASACEPAAIAFSEASLGDFPLVDWAWDFGDGNTDNGQIILPHIYNNAGVYTATLTVTDNRGCTGNVSQSITINPLPPVDFTAFRYGCAPIMVNFTDLTFGTAPSVGWEWDFGDGNTSTLQNPSHTYAVNGNYTVTLKVTDTNGCEFTLVRPNFIQLEVPTADFISDAAPACPPLDVRFTDMSVSDTTLTYEWDFGDGSAPSTAANPVHTYWTSDTFDVQLIVTDLFGCSDTVLKPQHVITHDRPNASFTLSDTTGCVPTTISMTSTSTGSGVSIVGYQWDFGTGSGTSAPSVSYLYTVAGTYTISLEVTDSHGCRDTAYRNVYINPNPSVDFTADVTLGCAIAPVQFTGTSSSPNTPVLWEWDFGDGNTGSGQNPINTYFTDGTYSVWLRATDANGCVDSINKSNYIVLDHPNADFFANLTKTCENTQIAFRDISTALTTIVAWDWDFGDGSLHKYTQNPNHTYTTAGTYDVTLIVTDALGCRDTLTQSTYIEVFDRPNAGFSYAPPLGCTPLTVTFTDTSTAASGNTLIGWTWDFGDGGGAVVPNPSYAFGISGLYTVSLTVTDNNNCTDIATVSVNALETPTVDFIADKVRGCAPEAIQFTDLTTSPYIKTGWFWDFGDGNSSTLPNPSHTYTTDGTYTVKLVVTDQNGCQDSLIKNAYIRLSHPFAEIQYDQSLVCPNSPIGVRFTDISTADTTLVSWAWDFGDGGSSTLQHPVYVYSTPGNFNITLTVTNILGCTDDTTYNTVISVRNGPDAEFTMSDTINCAPLPIQFTDLSIAGDGAITTWNWDFGDGFASLSQHPNHTFQNPGIYNVVLTTTDAFGCTNSDSTTVQALQIPVADFVSADTLGCATQLVNFTNLSTSAYNITYIKWLFGDGDSVEMITNPSHSYAVDGNYTVTLIMQDENGCSDTLIRPNYVRLSHPVAGFSFNNSQVCPGIPVGVSFTDTSVPDTTIVSWFWDFGDGNTASQQNPSHSYSTPGNYSVSLTVTNVLGCSDTYTVLNTVQVLNPPVAGFNASSIDGCDPVSISFSDISTAGDAPILSWNWDFGDGGTSVQSSPSHNFSPAGSYTVQLLVTDGNGCQDSISQNIDVYDIPVADFNSPDTVGCAPQLVNFTDNSSGTTGIVSWKWFFGDGDSSIVENPSHTYLSDGNYDVSLIVTNLNGCTDTIVKTAYIRLSHPDADFSLNSTQVCPGTIVSFTDQSNPDTTITSWLWDFGDGNSSTLQNPSHTYGSSGTYTVSLTITNILNCSDTEVKNAVIIVQENPTALFVPSVLAGCPPLGLSFTNSTTTGSHPVTAWEWDFGDGNQSSLFQPGHIFANPGIYTVRLVATNTLGCTDTFRQDIEVYSVPVAGFIASDTVGCASIDISFTAQNFGAYPISYWEWDFGDGNGSLSPVPVNTYSSDGTYTVSLIIEDINGCRDTLVKPNYIRLSHPIADFTANQMQICPGTQVDFADLSIPDTTLMNWSWDFGDGNSSNVQHPSHIYTTPGFYQVSLTVTNILNCSATEVKTAFIEVLEPPSPNFTRSDTLGCTPFTVIFQDASTGNSSPVVSWNWDFGNGNTSTFKDVSETFAPAGTYTIQLSVTDNDGCSASISKSIVATTLPQADFIASDTVGCQMDITFFDLSTTDYSIVAWKWYFGDGDSSSLQQPTHSYTSMGTYTVSLIVYDANGCTDTLTKNQYINISAPVANFGWSPSQGCPGLQVTFTDTSIPDTTLIQWSWDFGDGSIGNGPTVSHTYYTPGSYDVRLIVTNILGCSDTILQNQAVEILAPPVAAFSPPDTAGCLPLVIQFADQTAIGDTNIASILWDFGDGNTSALPNPNHSFNTAGFFPVQMIAIDHNGCRDTANANVRVHDLPQPAFTASDSFGCAPQAIQFSDQTGVGIVSWFWDFGDGNTSTQPFPNHTYAADGIYSVSLTVTDVNGCTNTLLKPNYIRLSHPSARFALDQDIVCPGTQVNFTDQSIPDTTLISWNWDFGDGQGSTIQNPGHIYTSSGLYTISLTVSNIFGCSDTYTLTDTVEVRQTPVADYTPSIWSGCVPLSVDFTNTSQINGAPIVSYTWDFGNGSTSGFVNPSTIFNLPGVYPVMLAATDNFGCTDTIIQNITVFNNPQADFIASDSVGCSVTTISFIDRSNPAGAPITGWQWDFGDGNTSFQPLPSNTYLLDGNYDVSLMVTDANGCADTLLKSQYIRLSHPVADFDKSINMVCPGTIVNFSDLSIPDTTLMSWQWDFGDGNSSNLQNPSHTYTSGGTYTISLTVTNVLGCTHTVTKTNFIDILSGPTANFFPSALSGCTPFEPSFTDASVPQSAPLVTWSWDFGDGNSSNAANPSHRYLNPGTYTVQLIVTDNNGCTGQYQEDVQALTLPNANFFTLDSLGCAPQIVNFSNLSTGDYAFSQFFWDFGDGNSSSQQTPSHLYANDGNYTVELQVEDVNGCRDTLVKPLYIRLRNPIPDFTLDQPLGCPGLLVEFTDTSIPDTTLVGWAWDFGDGNTSVVQNPSHTYASSGQYDVSLTITNVLGCSKTIQQLNAVTVTVIPTAAFQLTDTLSCAPFSLDIQDHSSAVSSPIVNWYWDFGNGDTDTLQEPDYTYYIPGTYTLSLKVQDGYGCVDSVSQTVIATDFPNADFVSDDTIGCAPFSSRFLDLSSGDYPIVRWEWDFGDGNSSSDQNPVHLYTQDGVYTVRLVVFDVNGCSDTLERVNYIRLSHPVAEFDGDPRTGCIGTTVSFTDMSIPDTTIVGWLWDFGDGHSSIQTNPQHSYHQAGNYDVQLIVTNILGCSDTILKRSYIQIYQSPTAQFTASDTAFCGPFLASFTDWSTGPYGITQWQWYVDSAFQAASQNTTYFFSEVGRHTAQLIVTDINGCQDTSEHSIWVHDFPIADFMSTDTMSCAPAQIQFVDLSVPIPVSWNWDFGDGNTSTNQNPYHTYAADGVYSVSLQVTDEHGCSSEETKINYISLDHPTTSFTVDYVATCPPVNAFFTATAEGPVGIATWNWDFGDGGTATSLDSTIEYTYQAAGSYDVSLRVVDSIGCEAVYTIPNAVNVLENIIPDPVQIHAVSVLTDHQVEIRFAAYAGNDFAAYTIYREEPGQGYMPVYVTYYVNDTLFIDDTANPSETSHCYKVTVTNKCDAETDLNLSRTHCTINAEATTLPGQVQLNWTDYIGWNQVLQYEIYRVDNYNPVMAEFLAVVPGTVTSFSETIEDCFTDISYRVKAIGQTEIQQSWSDTTKAVGENGSFGAATEVYRATVEGNQNVLVEWAEIGEENARIIYVEKSVDDGVSFQTLATLPNTELKFTDSDVEVSLQSYAYRVFAQDSCGNYTPLSNIGKSILLEVEKDLNTNYLNWTAYEEWQYGVGSYRIEIFNDTLGRWDLIDVVQGTVLYYEDQITNLDQPSYCYRIVAVELAGNLQESVSNEVCVEVETGIYAADAFTPNQDGINDIWSLKGIHVQTFNLQIFSRWGLLLFETNDLNEGWDGTFKGAMMPEGVYMFVARGRGFSGEPYIIKGNISLIR